MATGPIAAGGPLEEKVSRSSMEDSGRIARVIVLLRLHHLGDRPFDYLIPEELAGPMSSRVR